jgi:hypothetical protein
LFTTGPGPDAGGSKPGKDGCDQMPEKSGIDAAPCVPTPAGVAGRACPKAALAAIAASASAKRTLRAIMLPSRSCLPALRLDMGENM